MSNTLTIQNFPRRLSVFLVVLSTLLLAVGCGLTEEEQAVADVNNDIQKVEIAGDKVADAIAAQESKDGARDLSALRDATISYLEAVDALNATVRTLGETIPGMNEHVRSNFMPKSEQAAARCQDALDLLHNQSQVDDAVLRKVITRIGTCVDTYAKTVTSVSEAYGNLAQ